MSVHGEFQRVLRDCLDLLAEHEPRRAGGLGAELDAAARAGREDLTGGARRVLELLADESRRPHLAAPLAREAFRDRAEHLRALCRVILGS